MDSAGPSVHFLNLEYFFRLIYEALHGSGSVSATGSFNLSGLLTVISGVWLLVTVLAFLFALAAIYVLSYSTMRIFQIRKMEEPLYTTKVPAVVHQEVERSRWAYIQQLIESGQESDWRQAIIEADIMLDEVLTRAGYQGDTIGEKLKATNSTQFRTLNNAWEAHKVRNEIAHQGSGYPLSESLAHRTIAHYEAVFREFNEI